MNSLNLKSIEMYSKSIKKKNHRNFKRKRKINIKVQAHIS